jgi:ribonuclease BN (tRNA processing enzyme)
MASHTLTVLGCGATGNDLGWATSGYLLKTGAELTLIDCGAGITAEFQKRGFDIGNLNRVIISHTHIDHVSDLAYLIQSVYLTRRTEPLDIHLPEDFIGPFSEYLNGVYLFPERLSFELRIHGYSEGSVIDTPFRIKAIQNSHLQHYADFIAEHKLPNRMLSHCLELTVGSSRVFYSADITAFEEIKEHLPGCAYALIESTHVSLDEVIAYADEADVGCFIITHLGQGEEIAAVRDRVEAAGNERMIMAEPGLLLEL